MTECCYSGDSSQSRTAVKAGGHGKTIGNVVGKVAKQIKVS